MAKFVWHREAVACNLCGQDDAETLFEHDQHGFGLHTVICRICGLIYLNPRPSAADYDDFYCHWYHRLFPSRAAFHAGGLGAQIVSQVASLRRSAYQPYLSGKVRLLEVGCGEGAFLEVLQRNYPQARLQGIDLSALEVAASRRRGLPVICGRLRDLAREAYTHIAAFHTLEHALDPAGMLQEMAGRLEPGGFLFLEVPNILGSWRGLGMLHVAHPYQFCAATLSALLRRAGLSVVECEALEEPLLPASLRLVAKRAASLPPCPPLGEPGVAAMKSLFAGRLKHWRRDWVLGWLARSATRGLGGGLRNWLWEQTAGRRWRQFLSAQAVEFAALRRY